MAYTHSKSDVMMTASSLSATTSGVVAQWAPGNVPHIIRAFSISYTATGNTSSGLTVALQHLDLTSGSTASAIATLVGTSSDLAGHVVYKTVTSEVVVKPGEQVQVDITGAASGDCNFIPCIYVEPKWEVPGNNTNMRATT